MVCYSDAQYHGTRHVNSKPFEKLTSKSSLFRCLLFRSPLYLNYDYHVFQGPKHVPFRHEHRTDISLITGKIRATNLEAEDSSSLTALATQQTAISTLHRSGGGEFLLERSWQGLEQKLGETEVVDAVEGKTGKICVSMMTS